MANCPRCGSPKTSQKVRKEGTGPRAKETDIMDQWCDDCGWHGYRKIERPQETDGRDQVETGG